MASEIIGNLMNGMPVVDRHRSHIHDGVAALLPLALEQIDPARRDFFVEEVDFGRPIGEATCVETRRGDHVVFATRVGRKGLTRFVKNRQSEPTNSIVIVLMKAKDFEGYVLISAFFGRKAEPEEWDKNATVQSGPFWERHALLWGSESTVRGEEIEFPPLPEELVDPDDDYTVVLERAFALGKERHPNATPQHHAAFANSVAYAVTGMSGGYGGPSLREHVACRLTMGGGLAYRDAIFAVEETCYGPVTYRHAVVLESEHCFDDPAGDVKAAMELISLRDKK